VHQQLAMRALHGALRLGWVGLRVWAHGPATGRAFTHRVIAVGLGDSAARAVALAGGAHPIEARAPAIGRNGGPVVGDARRAGLGEEARDRLGVVLHAACGGGGGQAGGGGATGPKRAQGGRDQSDRGQVITGGLSWGVEGQEGKATRARQGRQGGRGAAPTLLAHCRHDARVEHETDRHDPASGFCVACGFRKGEGCVCGGAAAPAGGTVRPTPRGRLPRPVPRTGER
jgi:hypothetical protein